MTTNGELAGIFREMARMLELEEVDWKPRAYRKAAYGIQDLARDVGEVYQEGGRAALKKIPGVGESMADHIVEYLEEGRIEKFDDLREKYAEGITEIISLEGVGPKTAKRFALELGVSNLEELRKAGEDHRIRKLPGFGKKSEENVLAAIETYREGRERMLISVALPIAESILNHLQEISSVERINYVGSLRRWKETIGDVDILVASGEAEEVMEGFVGMEGVAEVLSRGSTRCSIILEEGVHVDLRVIPKESYAAAMQYFTGSREHNIALRKEALGMNRKLSEYGLFKESGDSIPCENEEDIYGELGMDYIPPELREDRGEIEAAKAGNLPDLISAEDMLGDLHLHTRYSDGTATIEEMAKAAQEKGYDYIAITDHSKSARIAGGMDEETIRKQWAEIDDISEKCEIRILKGAEVEILKDGSLDYSDEILDELEIVIGSVHSSFKLSKRKMTDRIERALEDEHLDILGHPSGRLIGKRPGFEADFPEIFEAAAERKKVLEINGQPERMDLNDAAIIAAREKGAKFCIDTDSISPANLDCMKYGLGLARRGWLTREEVVNTYDLKALKKVFRRIR
jgi:DNA polymerase (family 10)